MDWQVERGWPIGQKPAESVKWPGIWDTTWVRSCPGRDTANALAIEGPEGSTERRGDPVRLHRIPQQLATFGKEL